MKLLEYRSIRIVFLVVLGLSFGWIAANFRYESQKGFRPGNQAVASLFVPAYLYNGLWNLHLSMRDRYPVLHPKSYCCAIRDDQGNLIAWTGEAKEIQRIQVATLIALYYGLLFVLVGEMIYFMKPKRTRHE